MGDHSNLLATADPLDHRVLGLDFDATHFLRFLIEGRSIDYPLADDFIEVGTNIGDCTAFMGDCASRFQKHERIIRRGEVHAPCRMVVAKCPNVVDHVVAP